MTIDGEAIIAEIISIIAADSEVAAEFTVNRISEDDPASVSDREVNRIAVVLSDETVRPETLGARGTDITKFDVSIMIYLYDKNRTRSKKSEMARLTGIVNRAIFKYRVREVSGVQYWYHMDISKMPSTTYYTGTNHRQSITTLSFFCRQRRDLN